MKQKTTVTATLLGGALAGMVLGLTATRLTPMAKAAPTPVTATAAGTAADLLEGKTYPVTLKAEQFDSTYHILALVDAQGQISRYATRGETASLGGETFLVCYDVPLTDAKTHPPQPQAGAVGNLIYVNMRAVEAMGGIIPITAQPPAAPITAAP